jgi:hypothetical protein
VPLIGVTVVGKCSHQSLPLFTCRRSFGSLRVLSGFNYSHQLRICMPAHDVSNEIGLIWVLLRQKIRCHWQNLQIMSRSSSRKQFEKVVWKAKRSKNCRKRASVIVSHQNLSQTRKFITPLMMAGDDL